ncbi:MAG: aldolase/citrate lyase family protein [Trueperaceae bacterium]|jgi:4-hydroxy-2-oxoheptanedioate aldolase
MRINRLREEWRAGNATANAWLGLGDGLSAEIVARRGYDSVTFDLQHGAASLADVPRLLQAVSGTPAVPLVRVPSNDGAMIMRALDMGAEGVIVPMVETAAEARDAVAAALYPPAGRRSYGPLRAGLAYGPDQHVRANDAVAVFAMVETALGLENLTSIAQTVGLTGLYVGPADLSYAVGAPPTSDSRDPRQVAAVERILAACKAHDKVAGIHTGSVAFAREAAGRGFTFITVAIDYAVLGQEAGARLDAFRS